MAAISQVQNLGSGLVPLEEEAPSRPPDTAIRANAELLKAGMESFAKLAQAAMAPMGLNLVINGSNPSAIRAPEKISGVNGGALAAANLAGDIASAEANPATQPNGPEETESPQDSAPANKTPEPTPAPQAPAPVAPQAEPAPQPPAPQPEPVSASNPEEPGVAPAPEAPVDTSNGCVETSDGFCL